MGLGLQIVHIGVGKAQAYGKGFGLQRGTGVAGLPARGGVANLAGLAPCPHRLAHRAHGGQGASPCEARGLVGM